MNIKDLKITTCPGWSGGCVFPLQPHAYLLPGRFFAGYIREGVEKPGELWIGTGVVEEL